MKKENGRLSAVFAAGPHGGNEKTRVDEGKGRAGQGNHPKIISMGSSVRQSNEYLHSVQNEKLVLLLHQRAAPTTSHLGNTISDSQLITLASMSRCNPPIDTPNQHGEVCNDLGDNDKLHPPRRNRRRRIIQSLLAHQPIAAAVHIPKEVEPE